MENNRISYLGLNFIDAKNGKVANMLKIGSILADCEKPE